MLRVRIKKLLPGFNLEVDFSVDHEILAVLGPSGSGKTMTLHCIAGLIRPDEGYIDLNDKVLLDTARNINLKTQMRKVGFVFQNYALFPHLTVKDNIAYGIRHLSKEEVRTRVSELLEKMHISGLGQRYPRQLSAGQQQRVALARAIVPEPEVLLLDEPFSALDSQVKERLELELMNLQDIYKGHILFVTHDLAEGYKMASKIAVFESGRIVQCDYKNRIIESPANRTVARLTGFRNIIKAQITQIKGSTVQVKVPELAGELKIVTENIEGLAINQKITICIRPEYIHLVDHPGENTFLCVADQIIKGVSLINCFFRIPFNDTPKHWIEVSLHKSHASITEECHEYYVYFPPEYIVIIRD
ncbi:MAG: sulfate/molybdate ABC transporter ATP-binding protein [Dehalococcoidales bacterium]|nr:sulfate/molybdate ABC transporter ATP-binding protein [Dehalococcoidales bacterium]